MVNPKKRRKKKLQTKLASQVGIIILLLSFIFLFSSITTGKSIIAQKNKEKPAEKEKIIEKAVEKIDIVERIFGVSTAGKEVKGFEAGSGQECILIFAAIHGNEMGTADLLNKLVDEIKAKPSLVSSSKKLIIIPVLNPDGFYDREDKLNANEVNLNLNFRTSDWKPYGPEGQFAGAEPFSERESRLLKEIVEKYKPTSMISFHSQGAIVSPELNHEPSAVLAKWYSEKTGYLYVDEASWDYPGTATKWFAETYNKAAITVELTNHSESDWAINKPVLIELISK